MLRRPRIALATSVYSTNTFCTGRSACDVCPGCHDPIASTARFRSRCGSAIAPAPQPSDLADLDLTWLPYPVALTAQRLQAALQQPGHDVLKTLFLLKHCFEATVKYLGAILLVEFCRSLAATATRKEEGVDCLVWPSLGTWVNSVLAGLSQLLGSHAESPPAAATAPLVQRGQGQSERRRHSWNTAVSLSRFATTPWPRCRSLRRRLSRRPERHFVAEAVGELLQSLDSGVEAGLAPHRAISQTGTGGLCAIGQG